MICSDYLSSAKQIEINLIDIDEIDGGIISGTPAKPIYIHDGKNDVVVGISPHLKENGKLITIILSNVKKELYDSVLLRMKELGELTFGKGKKKPAN